MWLCTVFHSTGTIGGSTSGRKRLRKFARSPNKPIWVSEAGASSFGAEEVQVFGLQKTAELLLPVVERVHWYSLFDLPATWTATTRHKESEGSAYYRHYYMGLVREDMTPKQAAANFPEGLGICQWFHFEDPRLDAGVEWLQQLGVRYLRTGVSWADWFRPNSEVWFDRQMDALSPVPDDADAVLHAGASGHGTALHESSAQRRGLCGVRQLGSGTLRPATEAFIDDE